MANGMITDDCLQNDSFQFDNFISIHTKQLVFMIDCFLTKDTA